MLPIECPVHGSRVLVPASRIRSLHNTAEGILLDVECWCGTHVHLHTGRRQTTAAGPEQPRLVLATAA